MAKKTKKKATKKDRIKRSNRGWGQRFVYVKSLKVEPPKESVYGCIYYAFKKLKSGTVAEITDAAMKEGLNKETTQNPRIQTQIKLRRLCREGSAKKEKVEKEKKSKDKEKAAPKKKAAAKKPAPKKAPAKKAKKAAPKKESKVKHEDEDTKPKKAAPEDDEEEEDVEDDDAESEDDEDADEEEQDEE